MAPAYGLAVLGIYFLIFFLIVVPISCLGCLIAGIIFLRSPDTEWRGIIFTGIAASIILTYIILYFTWW